MQNFLVAPMSVTIDRVQRDLEETTEAVQENVNDLAEKEERNACVRASVMRRVSSCCCSHYPSKVASGT